MANHNSLTRAVQIRNMFETFFFLIQMKYRDGQSKNQRKKKREREIHLKQNKTKPNKSNYIQLSLNMAKTNLQISMCTMWC